MLALMKIGRISSGHAKPDNWVDLAGYAACGGEIEANINAKDESNVWYNKRTDRYECHKCGNEIAAGSLHCPNCEEQGLNKKIEELNETFTRRMYV